MQEALATMTENLGRVKNLVDENIESEAPVISENESAAEGLLKQAERLLWEFDQRGRYLPVHYFADPALMILLDLYAHACRRRRVSVSSLCIASRAPATTALRWIRLLVEDGLVERECDPHDARRVFVKLSVVGRNRLTAYLGGLSSFEARKDGLCGKASIVRLAADHGKAIK